jgi:hypothetical protein
LVATPHRASGDEGTVTVQVDDPNCGCGEIELQLDTTYSVIVLTYYKDSNHPYKGEDVQLTTPAEEEVRPSISLAQNGQKSATFDISYPPLLDNKREYGCERLQVKHVQYARREIPHGRDGDPSQREQGAEDSFISFKQCTKSRSASDMQQQPMVKKLKPGTKYAMKLRAEYNNGDFMESKEIEFETLPYTDCQNCFFCFGFLSNYTLLLPLLFAVSLFLCAMFGLYIIKLHRNEECKTEYIQSLDSVQCGEASSLQFSEIEITGKNNEGDTLQGVLQAWLVNKKHLKFYFEYQKPVIDSGNFTDREPLPLNGGQIYTWINSTIYGYCCIRNHGATEQTASLYMFTSDEDIINFIGNGGARNAILSDSIQIPPDGKEQCFRKWGPHAPFHVKRNSYHFIGVDFPANSSFSSNVTVWKMDVNTTGFKTPHFFKHDNSTQFPISFSLDEYIVVCKAPLYKNATTPLKLVPNRVEKLGATSLHIGSCNKPHHWMKIVFPSSLVIGVILLFSTIAFFIVVCVHWQKHRKRLLNFCKCAKRHPPHYVHIQEQEGQME